MPSTTVPVEVQIADPELQTMLICWHEPAGVQSVPVVQATQDPPWQTPALPASQGVPSVTSIDLTQVGAPPPHEVPSWQGAGSQTVAPTQFGGPAST